jgi:hypothetical protein
MNNYHQIQSTKYKKTNYQYNNKQNIERKHYQKNTVFYGTKPFPNAIIKNPRNGLPYVLENDVPMTVGQYGKYFFRVIMSNTNLKDTNHLYYEDISEYLQHHNVVLTDANIERKWNEKREYYENLLVKQKEPIINISDCSYEFTQPPWSAKKNM